MSEHDGVAHLGDIETALRREIELTSERFPGVDQHVVERLVRDTYAQLLNEAEVETHVLSLTHARVTDRLMAEGHQLHHAA